MRPELAGMKRGTKQMWLRVNRRQVENFYMVHGPEATMAEFNMMPATLERFFSRKNEDIRLNRLSENDRWVLKAAMEHDRAISRRVSELERWKEEVTPIINVVQALINATMGKIKAIVDSPAMLERYFRRNNFGGKLK